MTDAVFQAAYADWKLIKTRKVVQICFEIPIEHANLAYQTLGGMPNFGSECWCAIARLNPDNVKEVMPPVRPGATNNIDTPPASGPDIQARARKPVDPDKRIVQRIAILCTEPMFWRYLNERYREMFPQAHVTDEAGAADLVRFLCDVKSRKEILPGTRAADKWRQIYDPFCVWRDVPELAG